MVSDWYCLDSYLFIYFIPASSIVPLTLITHHTLATLTNGFLDALNELRECAPIAVAPAIAKLIHTRISTVSAFLQQFHLNHHREFDHVGLSKLLFIDLYWI